MIRILDLFGGLGGTARGIQMYLIEHNIPFEYVTVDINEDVLRIHKQLNPNSKIIKRDAYSFSDDELNGYDFIWASPPCKSHSRLNYVYRRYNPDLRLWGLINKLYMIGKPFIVENVQPYYKPPIKPKLKVDRHLFWSNVSLKPIEYIPKPKRLKRMNLYDLASYHNVPLELFNGIKITHDTKRQWIRNMVHYSISYGLFKQVYEKYIVKNIKGVIHHG